MSALPLLMTGIGAYHHHATMSTNDFALLTDGFDARADFHRRGSLRGFTGFSLFVSIGDPTSGEVVRGELYLDTIARQDSDVMHAHFSGDVGQHLVAIFKLDAKHCVGERFYNRSFKHNCVFLWLRQLVLLQTKVHA